MDRPRVLAGSRRWAFARLVGNGIAQGVLAFAAALAVRAAVDGHLVAGGVQAPAPLGAIGGVLLLTGLVAAWLRRRESVDAEMLGQDYALELRERMLDRITRLSPRVLGRQRKGGLFLRFVGDLTAIRQWVSLGMARVSVAGLMVLVSLALLALLDARLALMVAAVVMLGAVATLWLGQRMDAAVRASRRRRSQMAGTLGETLSGLATLQVFGQRRQQTRRLRKQANSLRDAVVAQAGVAGTLQAVALLTSSWATDGALLLGAWAVRSAVVTPGTVVAAMSVVALLVAPIRNLGRVYAYWRAARVAREKIDALMRMGPLLRSDRHAKPLRRGPGELVFDAVAVEGALQPLSGRIAGGARVALVGPNGAGKSTVLNLIGRLLDPDRGTIALDGQDLQRVQLNSLRRAIGWVGPELPLFRGSIESNLRFRHARASAAELDEVCRRCGLDRMLARWPHGLATRVNEGASNLSTGERYRIMLARALLGAPSLLLLDEADANLDTESRAILDRVIAEFPGTVVMASHRPQMAGRVDAIWRMADGALLAIEPATDASRAVVALASVAPINRTEPRR